MIVKNVVATVSAMSAEQNSQKARTSNAQVVQSSRKKRKNYNPLLKSVSESDSNTTMFYHSHSRMMARLLSGEKKSAITVMNLLKNSRKNFTLEDFLDSLSEEE